MTQVRYPAEATTANGSRADLTSCGITVVTPGDSGQQELRSVDEPDLVFDGGNLPLHACHLRYGIRIEKLDRWQLLTDP